MTDILPHPSVPPTRPEAEVANNAPFVTDASTAPDPFDPSALRISQNLGAAFGVRKLLNTVPVRKPSKEWFVRCHPNPDYRVNTCVVELKEEGEIYLVSKELWPQLEGESTFSPRTLVTAINKQGVVFLWPLKVAGVGGRNDKWSESAIVASDMATRQWIRFQSNMSLGAYEVAVAASEMDEPIWPTETLRELLRIAFGSHYINSLDHVVLRRLRGEA